ncbi:hypothetical protein GCM10007919_30420 [Rhizobium indigoferae]|nr:hypothetical protein GCM10007919_30420 [Rhizobium indigoferae]
MFRISAQRLEKFQQKCSAVLHPELRENKEIEHFRGATKNGNTLVAAAMLSVAFATGAMAHHGWSWAEADQIELRGTIEKISMGGPHPTLNVATANDGVWLVEIGNPRQTERSGFVEGVAKPGDQVVALGNRSQDPKEKRMKAVRLTIGEKRYDIYPDRIKTN